jgi:hypothetical protein
MFDACWARINLLAHTGTWAVLPMPGDCIRCWVTETSRQPTAEHGTLKLIIGGSDSHSPSVWLAVACLVDFWPLVEVARFGTHVGLEATVCSVGKLGLGGIT